MIRMGFGIACLWLVFSPALASAERRLPQQTVGKRPAVAAPLTEQRADLAPRTSRENRWRYSFRNGHWWYYRDGGRWAYWTGSEWRDYDAKSYGRWYVNQKMVEANAELARFDARTMRPYMDSRFQALDGGPAYLPPSGRYFAVPSLPSDGAGSLDLFQPRTFDGRLNPATSTGGYMGGALRGPFGY
jgi:hypothetical protein